MHDLYRSPLPRNPLAWLHPDLLQSMQHAVQRRLAQGGTPLEAAEDARALALAHFPESLFALIEDTIADLVPDRRGEAAPPPPAAVR